MFFHLSIFLLYVSDTVLWNWERDQFRRCFGLSFETSKLYFLLAVFYIVCFLVCVGEGGNSIVCEITSDVKLDEPDGGKVHVFY